MAEADADLDLSGRENTEENIDEENTERPNEPEEKSGPETFDEVPGKVGSENTEEKTVEKEKNLSNECLEEEVEADLAPIQQKENEEKPLQNNPFDIPTGRSRTQPETFDEENEEGPGRTAGRKKSVHLEKVVNKTIIDILEDLKEIHNSSYQKEIKRTSKKIGENVVYLKEILDDNL
ncbi:hypothetical protein [Methanococcus sp. CF]